jgi:hypothetical protein
MLVENPKQIRSLINEERIKFKQNEKQYKITILNDGSVFEHSHKVIKGVYFETGELNPLYLYVCDNIHKIKEYIAEWYPQLKDAVHPICHISKGIVKDKIQVHPTITIVFGHEDNFVSLSPRGSSIEITAVNSIYKGMGSIMMSVVVCILETLSLESGYKLKMFLECVGKLNDRTTPIRKQMEFFRRYGFRVEQSKSVKNSYGELTYVFMNYDVNNIDYDNDYVLIERADVCK